MSAQIFDDLTDVYEAMIDWPKRLANEGPFYRRLFDRIGAKSVVDVACGTGRHAAMFHSWGLRVEGADISPNMIDRARTASGEPEGLAWAVRGFDENIPAEQPFDAAVCAGNSLALAADMAMAERAIGQMLTGVRSGGLVVIHVLNLWRLADGPCLWQKCLRATLPEGEVLITKGVHRSGNHGYVDLIVATLQDDVRMQSESARLLAFDAPDLKRMVDDAGAASVEFFGNYQNGSYDRQESVDLIAVVQK
jgi:glycine/sarcosine N-methyltransferase